jgi:spore photoproduct lyase
VSLKESSLIKKVTRKQLKITESGRSTDFIAPSFGHGCLYNCSYCYMKRHRPTGLQVAENVDDVLAAITEHYSDIVYSPWYKQNKPNQTDDHYITYDIGSNEDLALHAKYYDINKIFKTTYGRTHLKFSFATKYVNYDLPDVSASIRIRFSLMPQKYSDVLEPETSSIIERIQAIDKFIDKGYEVHINFSPVIVTDTWIDDYRDLFMLVDKHVTNKNKVKCEVIFLTHNEKKHEYNLANNIPGEELLWRPDIQENKISSNGQLNIRYEHKLKADYIYQFRALHDLLIPWNTIRYIF